MSLLLEDIHNINHRFNRIFALPLFLLSAVVVFLMLFLPYTGRRALAWLINIFLNRPVVYLNYLGKTIGKPMGYISFGIIYFVIAMPFALVCRITNRPKGQYTAEASDIDNMY